MIAQSCIYSLCALGRNFSFHTSFTACCNDSARSVHTISTHKEKHPEFSLLEKPSVWEVQYVKGPLCLSQGCSAHQDEKQQVTTGTEYLRSSKRPFPIHRPSAACACSHIYFAKLLKLNETKLVKRHKTMSPEGSVFANGNEFWLLKHTVKAFDTDYATLHQNDCLLHLPLDPGP